MAEVGLIASGMGIASLGIQIGSGIIRLKQLWDDVKDAPEEIRYLLEEIDTLNEVLSTIDDSDLLPSTAKSLELCSRGAKLLQSIVQELEASMAKGKKLGGFKCVLKRGTIDRLRERLKSAVMMLTLSYQTYFASIQTRRHQQALVHEREVREQLKELNVTWSQSLTTTFFSCPQRDPSVSNTRIVELTEEVVDTVQPQSLAESNCKLQPGSRKSTVASIRQKALLARLRAPTLLWYHAKTMELYFSRAPSGWDFSIHLYNVVPSGSAIFDFAFEGDIEGIQRLLQEGKASLSDRTEFGGTVLDYAALKRRTETCRFLINQGADPSVSSKSSALEIGLRNALFLEPSPGTLTDLCNLLSKNLEIEDPFETATLTAVNLETLLWLLKASQSLHVSRSAEDIALFVIRMVPHLDVNEQGAAVRYLLDGRDLETMKGVSDEYGSTLLSAMASHLGMYYNQYFSERGLKRQAPVQLLALISDLVRSGFDVTSMRYSEPYYVTNLLDIVDSALAGFDGDPIPPLIAWLEVLRDNGIDLEEYGLKEKQMQRNFRIRKNLSLWKEVSRVGKEDYRIEIRFIGFDYGPEPADWRFWFTEELEPWFLEFWDMLDHPERAMPGAWCF
ncbi:hypothetical protein BDZ45DRAFT_801586 [Acephala macrosclerotiorum]|nr:hypothetical protein BDZ45DRAFT_801586 [Acephala macrosclerotiorum]